MAGQTKGAAGVSSAWGNKRADPTQFEQRCDGLWSKVEHRSPTDLDVTYYNIDLFACPPSLETRRFFVSQSCMVM